jgi:hypothetical protein
MRSQRQNPSSFMNAEGKCSGPPNRQNVLRTAKARKTVHFAHTWHLDLAGQGPADIQMLYYYITVPPKKQGVLRIFFNSGKKYASPPPDL